jgi:nitroreductase
MSPGRPQDVTDAIRSRMSTRAFRQEPVAPQTIGDILQAAIEVSPARYMRHWKVYVLQGASRDALVQKVCAAHDAIYADPALTAEYREEYDYYPERWVSPYLDRRRENGWGLYGLLGIAKGEKDKMHAQHHRNFRFFDAPVGLMFTLDRELARGSLIEYGMFLQGIMAAARSRGLDTCPQAAWNGFAKIILPHIGAQDGEMLVCGMSLGLGDGTHIVNTFHTPRVPVRDFTRWAD